MGDLNDYFSKKEFACPCCGEMHLHPQLLEKVTEARLLAGVPFKINSGFRCAKHNAEVGSTSENHTSGCAVDIACTVGEARRRMINGLRDAGFNRIGIAKTFIHADLMDYVKGAVRSYWLY